MPTSCRMLFQEKKKSWWESSVGQHKCTSFVTFICWFYQ